MSKLLVRNRGRAPISVTRLRISCPCVARVAAEAHARPVRDGGEVEVTFDSTEEPGFRDGFSRQFDGNESNER